MSHNIFSLNFQNDIFLPSGMVKDQKRIEVDVNKTVYLWTIRLIIIWKFNLDKMRNNLNLTFKWPLNLFLDINRDTLSSLTRVYKVN